MGSFSLALRAKVKLETITLIIAAWGAVLSTVTMGWNFFRDFSDRGRLRVSCSMGSFVQPGVGTKDNLLIWNVTNVGRQPVMLTNVGGEYSSKNNFVISTELPLPKMLQPGEYFTGWTDKHSELKKQEIKALTAIDSFGKIYKAPKKQVREIKEKLRKLKSNG